MPRKKKWFIYLTNEISTLYYNTLIHFTNVNTLNLIFINICVIKYLMILLYVSQHNDLKGQHNYRTSGGSNMPQWKCLRRPFIQLRVRQKHKDTFFSENRNSIRFWFYLAHLFLEREKFLKMIAVEPVKPIHTCFFFF